MNLASPPPVSGGRPSFPPRRGILVALLAAVVTLLGVAAPASAALPITFDSLAAGTTLADQFSSDHVRFLDPDTSGANTAPVIADVGAKASSGTRIAHTSCPGCEFVERQMLIQLSTFGDAISFDVGVDYSSATTQPLKVQALAADRSVLAQSTVNVTSTNYKQHVTIDPTGADNVAFLAKWPRMNARFR